MRKRVKIGELDFFSKSEASQYFSSFLKNRLGKDLFPGDPDYEKIFTLFQNHPYAGEAKDQIKFFSIRIVDGGPSICVYTNQGLWGNFGYKTCFNGQKVEEFSMGKASDKIVVIQDTREQQPLDLEKYGLAVEVEGLPFGDYSIKWPNLLDRFVIERKSLADFAACCGRERDRFERELTALRGYEMPYVVCEFDLAQILSHEYRSQINPNSLLSSIAKWATWKINFLFCSHAAGASYIAAKIIDFTARRIVCEAQAATTPICGKNEVPDGQPLASVQGLAHA